MREEDYQLDEQGNLLPEAEKPEYATMNRRLLAFSIDTFIAALPVSYVMQFFAGSAAPANSAAYDKLMTQTLTGAAVSSSDLLNAVSDSGMGQYFLQNNLVTMLFLLLCYFLFWHFLGNTPGKMLLGCEIVDAKTLNPPTRRQFYDRLFGYMLTGCTLGIGFLFMMFSKRSQALQDRVAATVVIRKRRRDSAYFS